MSKLQRSGGFIEQLLDIHADLEMLEEFYKHRSNISANVERLHRSIANRLRILERRVRRYDRCVADLGRVRQITLNTDTMDATPANSEKGSHPNNGPPAEVEQLSSIIENGGWDTFLEQYRKGKQLVRDIRKQFSANDVTSRAVGSPRSGGDVTINGPDKLAEQLIESPKIADQSVGGLTGLYSALEDISENLHWAGGVEPEGDFVNRVCKIRHELETTRKVTYRSPVTNRKRRATVERVEEQRRAIQVYRSLSRRRWELNLHHGSDSLDVLVVSLRKDIVNGLWSKALHAAKDTILSEWPLKVTATSPAGKRTVVLRGDGMPGGVLTIVCGDQLWVRLNEKGKFVCQLSLRNPGRHVIEIADPDVSDVTGEQVRFSAEVRYSFFQRLIDPVTRVVIAHRNDVVRCTRHGHHQLRRVWQHYNRCSVPGCNDTKYLEGMNERLRDELISVEDLELT